jgi:hypothetical protein
MAEYKRKQSFTARANAAFLQGQGDKDQAIVSTVVVRASEQNNGDRLGFIGPAQFEEKIMQHIRNILLPLSENVIESLGLPKLNYCISVANLGAASVNDIGLKISGFSADVPVLLGILAASLNLSIPDDVIATGHIASLDGDIGMVKGVPAKVQAAITAKMAKFICPTTDQDSSLDCFTPLKMRQIRAALAQAKREIKIIAVRDINDLVQAIFSDEQVVLASLRQGFFEGTPSSLKGRS